MKVPARVKSAFRSRNVLHFFVSFLLLQNAHIKRVVARSHHEVCVSSKARRSCSISPRGVFRVVERAFKKRLREREREREHSRETFIEQNRKRGLIEIDTEREKKPFSHPFFFPFQALFARNFEFKKYSRGNDVDERDGVEGNRVARPR